MTNLLVKAMMELEEFKVVRWCKYHDAQIVNDRDQECWDSETERGRACVPVDAVLAIGDVEPAEEI